MSNRLSGMPVKVLVVGMMDSVHLARWLSQFKQESIEFFLFPSSPHRRVHETVTELLQGNSVASFKTISPLWLFGAPAWIADKVLRNKLRSSILRLILRSFQPNVIHALELQNAGYIVERCLSGTRERYPELRIIVTNYGSDIFWFSKYPKHRERLVSLLALADAYSCECHRDVQLARELGFSGQVMPVAPNAGGFSEAYLSRSLVDLGNRKAIAVKGYEGWVGRAITALEGLEDIASMLTGYKIVIYSCNRATMRKARKMRKETSLDIEVWGKGQLTHKQMLQLFSNSIVYVGISESDGISTSLLEAMASGAIPVQTSSACCDEWFDSSGVKVNEISPTAIGRAILRAIDLAHDPRNALKNRATIFERAHEEKVRSAALQYYLPMRQSDTQEN